MTNFILYHINSLTTGKVLQEALGIPGGQNDTETRLDYLIRWGNRASMRYKARNVLNSAHAINNTANKVRAFQLMEEHDIPHPRLVDRFDGELLLGRPETHMHGEGSYFITSQKDLERAQIAGCNHFQVFVPIDREFRVHIFKPDIIFSYERVWPSHPPYPKSLNIRNDWHEVQIESYNLPVDIRETAKKAVVALELDFGAVDIGLSVSGKPVVFEVNTAPALVSESDGRITRLPSFGIYLDKFRRWLGNQAETNDIIRIANH